MNNSFDSDNQKREHVSLHIERLVLDGFAYSLHERGELRTAIQRQLTALIAQGGLGNLSEGGMVPALHAEGIQIRAVSRPAQVGAMVAGSIFNSLNQKQ
jgi:hypothetical protein